MSENHYAVVGVTRNDIPTAEYQAGDIVTVKGGSYRITGRPHRQWYGSLFRSVSVYWPAEEVELDSIPLPMRRRERD